MPLTAIQNMIVQAALSAGIDPGIALGVAKVESNFNPSAIGPVGEIGIFQLMPSTAAGLGISNPYDATQNIQGGVNYLAELLSEFGTYPDALAAYNWGPGNVNNVGPGGDYPASVQNYIASVLGQASVYSAAIGSAPVTASSGPLLSSATLSAIVPTTPAGYALWGIGGLLVLWTLLD
jgi:soluble lytic murein transglycosylase-like protein